MKRCLPLAAIFTFISVFGLTANVFTIRQQRDDLLHRLPRSSGTEKINILLELVNIQSPDSLSRSFTLTWQAIGEARRLNSQSLLAKVYVQAAALSLRPEVKNDSAEYYLLQARKAFAACGSNLSADYYYCLARYHYRRGDFDNASAICQLALQSAEAEKKYTTAASIQILMAHLARKNDDFRSFTECLGNAEKSLMFSGEKLAIARDMITIGIMYKDAGMNETGDLALVKATSASELTGDSLYLGFLYCNVAGILGAGNNGNETYTYLNKAVSIFEALRFDKGLGYANNSLGTYYYGSKNYGEAIACFSKAVESYSRVPDWQGACFAACNKAEVYMELRKYGETSSALAQANEFMAKSGDKLASGVYYNLYAEFLVLNKMFTEAFASYDSSIMYAKESFNQNLLLENLKAVADLYQATGDVNSSLLFYKKYIAAGDSLKIASNELRYADMRNDFFDKSPVVSKKRLGLQSLAQGLRKAAVPVAAGVVLLLMVFSVWAFRDKKIKNKSAGTSLPVSEVHGDAGIATKHGIHLSDDARETIWHRLNNLLENDKCYLRSDLSLNELATLLGTNSSYLSRVINDMTGSNFNSYVNKFRIEESCRMLSGDRRHVLSIEGIARSVGFNSKSAFNAAFKKYKGMTPSEFSGMHQVA